VGPPPTRFAPVAAARVLPSPGARAATVLPAELSANGPKAPSTARALKAKLRPAPDRLTDEGAQLKPERARDRPTGPADTEPRPDAQTLAVDQMGEQSFPASDPPACWTWEPKPEPVKTEDDDETI